MFNTLSLVQSIIYNLEEHGILTVLFGGWAEELNGTISPRKHNDIDLLYIANTFEKVDDYIAKNAYVTELSGKHFPHKRAFLYKGVMVELLLINIEKNKLTTSFWGDYILTWPCFQPKKFIFSNNHAIQISPPFIIKFYQNKSHIIDFFRRKNTQVQF